MTDRGEVVLVVDSALFPRNDVMDVHDGMAFAADPTRDPAPFAVPFKDEVTKPGVYPMRDESLHGRSQTKGTTGDGLQTWGLRPSDKSITI